MKRSSAIKRLGQSFRRLDQFPETVQFTIDGQETMFKTKVGAFCSLVMIVLVLAFGLARWVQMVHHEHAQITITTMEDFYTEKDILEGEGFSVALALYGADFSPKIAFEDFGQL